MAEKGGGGRREGSKVMRFRAREEREGRERREERRELRRREKNEG